MTATFRVGGLDLAVVSDGLFLYDAGAVFGLVPRVLWEPFSGPLDDTHRMSLGLNSLLVRSQEKLILIETGLGDKAIGRVQQSRGGTTNLLQGLGQLGIRPTDVDVVINTHLHSDHCGWNTRYVDGVLVPTFPNAEYLITRDEWLDANAPNERTQGTYLVENLKPIQEHGLLKLVDGETRVTDEIFIVPTPGHTAGHASVVLSSRGETALYIGDIAQTTVQLERTAWVSAFDVLPLVSLQTKKKLVEQAIREKSVIIGVHFAYPGLGHMQRVEGQLQWQSVPANQSADSWLGGANPAGAKSRLPRDQRRIP